MNGKLSVKDAVDRELAEVDKPSPELRCIQHLASALENLPCIKHTEQMKEIEKKLQENLSANNSIRDKVIGGLIALGAVVAGSGLTILLKFLGVL